MNTDWQTFQQAAQRISEQTGFPLAVLLGQAAVETGRDPYNAPGNNWFGIKGSGNAGTNNLATQEAGPNGFYGTQSNFRAYHSPEDSIIDYIQFIQQHFPQAMQHSNDPEAMIRAIAQGGYATDPSYVQKVMSTPEFQGAAGQKQNLFQKMENAMVPQAYAEEPKQMSAPERPGTYTVKDGDTLWDIALDRLGSGNRWKELQGYHGSPNQMPVGTQLQIPNASRQQPNMSTPNGPQYAPPPAADHLVNPVYGRQFQAPSEQIQKALTAKPQQPKMQTPGDQIKSVVGNAYKPTATKAVAKPTMQTPRNQIQSILGGSGYYG
jgi:LysM repeat protein